MKRREAIVVSVEYDSSNCLIVDCRVLIEGWLVGCTCLMVELVVQRWSTFVVVFGRDRVACALPCAEVRDAFISRANN